MNYQWSEWTNEEWPSMTCRHIELEATIKLCLCRPENGERTRNWQVTSHGAVIASGFTTNTSAAIRVCETIISYEGDEFARELMVMSMNKPNPRFA